MFRSEYGHRLEAEMLDSGTQFSDMFDMNYVRTLFEQHRSGRINHEKQLYLLTVMHFWFKTQQEDAVLQSDVSRTW